MAMPGSSPSAVDPQLSITIPGESFFALRMTGYEHLGQLPEYTVELAGTLNGDTAVEVDLHALLGKTANIKVRNQLQQRYFNGYVVKASRLENRGRYPGYRVTVRPWLWFLTQRRNSRVFQEKSVKEILTDVFTDYPGHDVDWQLGSEGDYPKLDYCVQYEETDYDFISRILEEAGIYYFVQHEDGKHKIVFIDTTAKHEALPDATTIQWRNAMADTETITRWNVHHEVRSIKTVLTEFDYLDPTNRDIKGQLDFSKKLSTPIGPMEWFEHPARVVQNSAKATATPATTPIGNRAKARMGEVSGLHTIATGVTNALDFAYGAKFTLANFDTFNGDYLIVGVVYRVDFDDYRSINGFSKPLPAGSAPRTARQRAREAFQCEFLCQSTSLDEFRSPRVTRKPVIPGPQTAFVVGTSSNEIETDEHGRVKVQFHWDRLGANDEKSSCWVRVMTPWASKGYGMVGLPRVGDEVVVQFLDGDPDRPLVVGAVYNKVNTLPWKLPGHAAVSGIRSRSTKEGAEKSANELRFDDTKDSEYIWMHAEKDRFDIVKNDAFFQVGKIETIKIGKTRNEAIGENWFLDVTNDVMHHVGKDLHVNVEGDIFYTGGATFQVKLKGDLNIKLESGDLGIDVGMKKIQAKAGGVVIEAPQGITLKCGGSLVNIGPAGVDIVGAMVKVNSGGGGGSASPGSPAEAKKEASLTESAYKDKFKDPLPEGEGGLPEVAG